MISISADRLIIDLAHPEPEEFLNDLRDSLFAALRLMAADSANRAPLLTETQYCNASFAMLQLLEVISAHNSKVP